MRNKYIGPTFFQKWVTTLQKYLHPRKQEIGKTPIPSFAGEMLHIDVYSTAGKYFLTCIDKFSKFAVIQPIRSRALVDIKAPLLQLLNMFPETKAITATTRNP